MPITVVPDVILHEEEGEAFLLHVGTGRYYGLNKSGLIVWKSLVEKIDPITGLQAAWPDRSAENLQADADALVHQLLDAGLIREAADEPDS